jgi:hypothetical protein
MPERIQGLIERKFTGGVFGCSFGSWNLNDGSATPGARLADILADSKTCKTLVENV